MALFGAGAKSGKRGSQSRLYAPLAAIIIAIVGWVVTAVLSALGISAGSGLVGAIVHLVIAAIVLMLSDRILPDLQVGGFGGAIVGAIAMGVVAWLITLVLNALGMALL